MNIEKLDALAIQAGFDVERLRAPHPGGFPREDMLALESFAELIVREMCDVFDKRAEPGTGFYEPHEPVELIKQHFGVEE